MSNPNKPDSPPGQDKPKPNDPRPSNPIYDPPGESGGSPPHGAPGKPGGGNEDETDETRRRR